MPRNGSGTYGLVAGNPVTTGTTISSTWANNTLSDIATALTNSIAKDGQTTPTANLPMGSFKLTGLAIGTANTDSITLGQAQNQGYLLIGTIAGVDTITGLLSPAITAYVAGQKFCFVSAGANTGAVTININSLGAKNVTKLGTTALVAGDIASGALVTIVYDGTQFQLTGASATRATNLSGGVAGAIPFQSAVSTTGFTAAGTAGQVLTSAGAGTPTWGSKVANLTGGGAGQVPYQSAADTTAFLAAGTSGQVLKSGGTGAPTWATALTLGTQASTGSGTAVDYTGLPAGLKRITIMFDQVSVSTADDILIQIGSSGGLETTTYVSSSVFAVNGGASVGVTSTAGFVIYIDSAANTVSGTYVLNLMDSATNKWCGSGAVAFENSAATGASGGTKAIAGVLDRIRITNVTPAAFDGGNVNISYE